MQTTGNVGRWALVVGSALLASVLLYALRGVLTPVFFAFLLAYLLDPVADRLEAMRIPRAVAVGGLIALTLLVLALVLILGVPVLVDDLTALAQALPRALRRLFDHAVPWLEARGIEVPSTTDEIFAQLPTLSSGGFSTLRSIVGQLLGSTASALSTIGALLIVPVFASYLLLDFDRLMASLVELTPARMRPTLVDSARAVDTVLGHFVRGQLLVMLILAALYAGSYALIGVAFALPIGIVSGLLAFIPYVGGAIALGLGLLMTVLHDGGFSQAIAVVVAYSVVQLLESFVITPYIVGDTLGLSPLAVLFALMVGGELFGFLGVMLALPAAAVAKVFVERALLRYRASAWYGAAAGRAHPAGHAAQVPTRLRHRPAHTPLHVRRRAPRAPR